MEFLFSFLFLKYAVLSNYPEFSTFVVLFVCDGRDNIHFVEAVHKQECRNVNF